MQLSKLPYLDQHGKKPILIFDLDGTLVDTASDLINALNILLREEKLPTVDPNNVRPLIGRGPVSLIAKAFGQRFHDFSEQKKQEILIRFIGHYENHLLDHSTLYPNVISVLTKFKAEGYDMAICTGKGTKMAKKIAEGLRVAHFFKAICGGDFFCGVKKPDKAHVLGTIHESGRTMEHGAIFIGDSDIDVVAAKNTNIPIVYATYGYNDLDPSENNPDQLISNFGELPMVIFSWGLSRHC